MPDNDPCCVRIEVALLGDLVDESPWALMESLIPKVRKVIV
jgi:hypothetical protein